jgi:transcriptional regulator GlxA family with amidase domain
MRKVGALIFPGFELLDLFGPLEMLGLLKDDFELKLVAERLGPVASNQGIAANTDITIDEDVKFDVIVVPGGAGTRREVENNAVLDWIAQASETSEYSLSICTGSALFARAGVLDGKRATTNKAAFPWVVEQGPKVEWVKQARWVECGKFITSSGVSAGMDMTLGAIALMHGTETAEKVAKWSEYTWHRDKDDDPFAQLNGPVE